MLALRLLSVAAAALCLTAPFAVAQEAPCASPLVTSQFDSASYSTTYTHYAHAVKLTTEYIAQPQKIHSLGLQLAPMGDPTHNYNVRLGLYQKRNDTLFVRLGQTDNIVVSGALAANGTNLYASVQEPFEVTAGTYFLARVADMTGLQVYGNGNFTQPGSDLFYDDLTSLPNLVVRSFFATMVRAAVIGCPLVEGGVAGDPTFYGFHGQVFQVHGIAGYIFNLLTSSALQLNARFDFLDSNSHSLNQGEQASLRSSNSALPNTPAYAHAGTYLGLLGLRLGASSLHITPGAYVTGFKSVTVDGKEQVAAGASYPKTILSTSDSSVTLVSPFVVRVVTPLLRFDVVNSDLFVNVQRAQLLSSAAASALDGILGQSADAKRWFPAYGDAVDAAADVKGEWQQAQIHDFLIVDGDILSNDFERNKFAQ